jgi:hypothetical protein
VRRVPQGEAVAVWALFGADLLAILIVYSLVDPHRLHNVSHSGIAGGLSRALVQLNFPIAIVALPLTLLALASLPRRAWWVGGPALALCAAVAWPGVVDQDDLDAEVVNVVPALGVALALALTVVAAHRSGTELAPRTSGDTVRIVVASVAILLSLPWIAAEVGAHFPPLLFLTDEPYREPRKPVTAAVHLGHHHGLDGLLFVLAALLLSRRFVPGARLRLAYRVLVCLLLVYGVTNLAQDFWHEQFVKRGWTDWDMPSALVPRLHVIWLLMLAAAAVAYALGFAKGDTAGASRDNRAR